MANNMGDKKNIPSVMEHWDFSAITLQADWQLLESLLTKTDMICTINNTLSMIK